MEYADGGTLASYLIHVTKMIGEREILVLFHQIVSAIRHMHEHNILHR
jgi:serine/threonine protein kinase